MSSQRLLTLTGGVDYAADPAQVDLTRCHRMTNLWRDRRSTGAGVLRTVPGYRRLCRFDRAIHGLHHQRVGEEDFLLVHSGVHLYRVPLAQRHLPRTLAALPPICTLHDRDSVAVSLGEEVYLLDGEGYYRIDGSGTATALTGEQVYIPVTHHNGLPYEGQSLLTPLCRHTFTVTDLSPYADATPGLLYTVTDREAATAEVAVPTALKSLTAITVPSQVELDGVRYTVTAVAAAGFANCTALETVHLPRTLTRLGSYAFSGATALAALTLPDSVSVIGSHAFYQCTALTTLHVGRGIARAEANIFLGCTALTTLSTPLTEAEFAAIPAAGRSNLHMEGLTRQYETAPAPNPGGVWRFPLYLPTVAVREVTLDGTPLATDQGEVRYTVALEKGRPTAVCLAAADGGLLAGRAVSVTLHAESEPGDVRRCRLLAAFDGRLFLSGDPDRPDTVFYTGLGRNGLHAPDYIPVLHRWQEGEGGAVSALLPLGDGLLVTKDSTVSEGCLYLHRRRETGQDLLPVIYPSEEGFAGVGCVGAAVNFGDDPVLLSRQGLWGVDSSAVTRRRSLSRRSSRIDPRLCHRDMRRARMAVWGDWLCILHEGVLYLGDGRAPCTVDGHREYEWYPISGVGSFAGDRELFFHTTSLPNAHGLPGELGLTVHPHPEQQVIEEVYSVHNGSGEPVFYVDAPTGRHPVDTCGQRQDGVFSPATVLCAVGELLFFGTEDGSLSMFNTDKRNAALYRQTATDLYLLENGLHVSPARPDRLVRHSQEELVLRPLYRLEGTTFHPAGEGWVFADSGYLALCEPVEEATRDGEIPRYYYSFQHHAYVSGLSTRADDCNRPDRRKRTRAGSLLLFGITSPGTLLSLLVRTDRHDWQACEAIATAGADARDTDLAAFAFSPTGRAVWRCREKEKGWREKQLQLFSPGFRAPFGISRIVYQVQITD